jgi:hypothetical protein
MSEPRALETIGTAIKDTDYKLDEGSTLTKIGSSTNAGGVASGDLSSATLAGKNDTKESGFSPKTTVLSAE